MSLGSIETDYSEDKFQAIISRASVRALMRIKRKAAVIMIGASLVIAGQMAIIPNSDETSWQAWVESANYLLLFLLIFFAWHIRRDAARRA